MAYRNILLLVVLVQTCVCVRINFTSCQDPEWSCVNDLPNDIIYSCTAVRSEDFTIHLKDYYSDHITSVVIQNCKDVKVVLDCPILQRASNLQRFKVKNCHRLEFITLSSTSLVQTPAEVIIENVNEVISLPKRMFKSPITTTEQKCLGAAALRKILFVNSKINTIHNEAIYNVTGIKNIVFDNVTILNVQNQAIEAIMGLESVFTITDSKIHNLDIRGIVVHGTTVTVTDNTFNDINTASINITSDNLYIVGNTFKEIRSNGLVLKSVNTEISQNDINKLKSNAFNSIKCLRKRSNKKTFTLSRNRFENVESNSLTFDYASCKTAGTAISITDNKIDCRCQNIAYLNTASELNNIILDVTNNNTCLSAPCNLPVDVVKMLIESDMCQLTLDPQVMCLLYNDKHSSNNDVNSDEEVTEPAPIFYLIRQAISTNGDASAMTAVDKDDLLKGSHLNMTNRTAIKVVFDSSKDFVETLRSTSTLHKRPVEEPKTAVREEYINRCVGAQCRNNVAYDRQKALDFYKYVYAQLRPQRPNDNKKKKT